MLIGEVAVFFSRALCHESRRVSSHGLSRQPRVLLLQMLEHHLGNSFMEKEEIDKKTVIRTNWKKLIKQVNIFVLYHTTIGGRAFSLKYLSTGRGVVLGASLLALV